MHDLDAQCVNVFGEYLRLTLIVSVKGIREESIQKKLLQDKKLSLSHTADMGRSGWTTNIYYISMKELKYNKQISETEEAVNSVGNEEQQK